jgi:hypothetical protein
VKILLGTKDKTAIEKRDKKVLFFAYPQIESTLLGIKKWCMTSGVNYAEIESEFLGKIWDCVEKNRSPYHESVYQTYIVAVHDFASKYALQLNSKE